MNLYKKAGLGIAMGLMSMASFAQTVDCSGVADWSASGTYNDGDQVVADGILYEANWWTQDDPATNNGGEGSGQPWTVVGTCGTAEPEVQITSPSNNQVIWLDDSGTETINVAVDVNDEEVSIDSVQYIVVERTCYVGGCTETRRFTETTAPYTLTFNPLVGANYTEVIAIAFSNGIGSDESSIDLDVNAIPELSITAPADEAQIYLKESENPTVEVTVDVNDEVADIDSVRYTVVDVTCSGAGCADVRRFTTTSAPFSLDLEPNFESLYGTEIYAVAFSEGRPSNEEKIDLYINALPEGEFTNITDGQDYYVTEGEDFNVLIDVNDEHTTMDSVEYFITQWLGGPNVTYSEVTVTDAPYTLSFLPEYEAFQTRIVAVVYGDGGKTAGPSNTDVFIHIHALPQGEFTNITEGGTYDVNEGENFEVQLDVNDEHTTIDSVEYFVTEWYNTQSPYPNYREFTVYNSPYNLSFAPEADCYQTRIVAVVYGDGGKTAGPSNTDVFVTFNVEAGAGARIASENEVNVFPNPMSDVLNIENAGEFTSFEITDIAGQTIATGSLNEGTATISTADLNAGLYTVVLKGAETKVVKVMK